MARILTESLYEIAPELRVLMESEDFESERFDELVMAFEKKAEGITYFMGELEAFVEMAKAEAKRISDRAKTAQNRADSLKAYLKGCMEESGVLELEFGTKKLRVQDNPPKLVVDRVDEIPAEYKNVEIVTTIDKAAIKRVIKAGKHVSGCHTETGTNLRIR
jgi:hypothetical protein